jgi:hypothetical protein
MALFENTLKLRGFLAKDAEAPVGDIKPDTHAVLFLATVSGTWDVVTSVWTPSTNVHRVVCPGPYFCGFTRGMKQGDYVEVEGELYIRDPERPVVVEGERFTVKRYVCEVRALKVRRLERPSAVVDASNHS